MKIPIDYLKGFFERKIIPLSAWSMKFYKDEECFEIKNSIYCNVFWVDFWYHCLQDKFKNQKIITELQKQDLTSKVIISKNFELINAPQSIQNILYYGNYEPTTPFVLDFSITTVFIFCLTIFILIAIVTTVFFNKSPYLYYF